MTSHQVNVVFGVAVVAAALFVVFGIAVVVV